MNNCKIIINKQHIDKFLSGKDFVIWRIYKEDIKDLINLAKQKGLKIDYPDMFNTDNDLYKIHISNTRVGGIVSGLILYLDRQSNLNKFTLIDSSKEGMELLKYLDDK